MINLLLFNNFCPVISYRRVQKERRRRRVIVYYIGHSLWSANQLPARSVESIFNFPAELDVSSSTDFFATSCEKHRAQRS